MTAPRPTPKYRLIYDHIQEKILGGKYRLAERLPSESELVKAFGASRVTVNRALRELQLAGMIERRAGSGSYVRAQAPQGHTFGLLIPEFGLSTEIFEPICAGMARAQQDQHHVLLWGQPLPDVRSKAVDVRGVCAQMIAARVSGVFFAPLSHTQHEEGSNHSIARAFDDAGIPLVLLDRDLVSFPQRSKYDVVGIDNRRAGFMATSHLVRLGSKRLMFVRRPLWAATIKLRIDGFRAALEDAELPFRADMVCRLDPADRDQVEAAMEHVRPDGIVCANDHTAVGLMRTFRAMGIRVPDDVRVTGVDDVKCAAMGPVPLTTVHQPCAEIGATAIAAMMHRIHNPALPARDFLLDIRLVVRESCGGSDGVSDVPEPADRVPF